MPDRPEPPVTFSTFLVSIASTALQSLPADPRLAQHTQDLLDIIAAKTKGNLDEEEARLLEALQGELRQALSAHPRV